MVRQVFYVSFLLKQADGISITRLHVDKIDDESVALVTHVLHSTWNAFVVYGIHDVFNIQSMQAGFVVVYKIYREALT